MEEQKIDIIIADNNKTFCNILNEYLSMQKDIRVLGIADNGVEALKLIEEKNPNLVILDLILPILNGWGVLERLNRMDLKPMPLIIVLSVVGQDSIIQRALLLGADYYVVKPFNFEVLIKIIRQMLNSKI